MRRVLWALVLLIVLVVAASWWYVHQALPKTDGVVRVQGLKAEVRISRDAHGIPTIRGDSLADVMWGLGFVHAQDRLWQLEMHRRVGAGQLAEAFGDSAVGTDVFLRSLGVRRAAEQQLESVAGEARGALDAYAAGINAYVARHMGARPPEFLALGLQPGRWEPADSLAWMTMMAWDLGGNWNNELLRMRLALKLPVERINELLPPYPGEKPLPTMDYAALYRGLRVDAGLGERAQRDAPESGIEGVGSNNWVVAGSHTESGKPLLANDPHLRLSAPALWYFARLEAPGYKVAGATMPGLPAVVLGQNEHVAWGYTNTAPDVQDLYLEQLHPDDPMQYLTPEGWKRFETREEVIKVKGRVDTRVTVRASRHGPVISDAPGAADGLTGPRGRPAYALAMRWTALDAPNTTFEAGLAMNKARSVDEFVAASALHIAPMQNMVVADTAGRIGMVAAGRVPVRGAEHDLRGLAPAPGWEARYDWTGFLDPTLTPREFDPPRGWIATANQRIHAADYPHYLTSEWTVPYRQQRIEQLLQAAPRHGRASMAALQADQVSLAAQRLLPWIRKARSSHPLAADAQQQLAGSRGNMAADQAAPLILWAWTRQLYQLLIADELGPELWKRVDTRSFYDAVEGMLEGNNAWWCDNKTTAAAETCQQIMDLAFDGALRELQAAYGAEVAAWRWGEAHQARSEHRPFSKVKPLAQLFELRVPVGGDTHTVNASRVSLKPDELSGALYLNEHGPSLRAIYDLGTPAASRVMHSSGQSGLPFSRLYRGFMWPWAKGEYVPLWGGESESELVLQPQ
ncbi:penicillin acylase family protein [Aquabacterium sp. A7-Y]|uniref:penicillin acylase family protein n=1 Tax=Aquabacterium sp. A7-Y TaxID=1349605 RepID=UPI00223D9CC7|nr:penicillin acylase family protein [Aquabacterium sp. A7-Y]MCW7539831.1 penicillin acylase family protein [Aquabacterium sp. A7-Y]